MYLCTHLHTDKTKLKSYYVYNIVFREQDILFLFIKSIYLKYKFSLVHLLFISRLVIVHYWHSINGMRNACYLIIFQLLNL